jgi:hypothetical protein
VKEIDFTQKYNRKAWLSFLEDSLLPEDFSIDEKEIPANEKLEYAQTITRLGESASLGLTVLEVKHRSTNDAHIGLSKDAFRLVCNYTLHSRALVLFIPQNKDDCYRFSLVEFTPVVNEQGKVKRDYSNPRRYSYLLGEGCKLHTPELMLITKGRVKDNADLFSRFAVDVVTKEFYQQLFKWYDEYAVPQVLYSEGSGASVRLTAKNNHLHLIRLITRLIFVWFIKQKGLIPDWIFDEKEITRVLRNFDPHSKKSGNFYNGIIQNLFFATLNKAVLERKFTESKDGRKHYGIKTYYRDHGKEGSENSLFSISHNAFIKKFETVPFLNGGLFECLDHREGDESQEYHDGFSRESSRSAFIPNMLFWGSADRTTEGIIQLFSRYNFTVEENTPQDVDIALDPELLAKCLKTSSERLTKKLARPPAMNVVRFTRPGKSWNIWRTPLSRNI